METKEYDVPDSAHALQNELYRQFEMDDEAEPVGNPGVEFFYDDAHFPALPGLEAFVPQTAVWDIS